MFKNTDVDLYIYGDEKTMKIYHPVTKTLQLPTTCVFSCWLHVSKFKQYLLLMVLSGQRTFIFCMIGFLLCANRIQLCITIIIRKKHSKERCKLIQR